MVEAQRKTRDRKGGSVFFRSARGVWVAEVKRPDGRTATRTAKTRPAAERLLVELQADTFGGVVRAGRDLLTGDWIRVWLGSPTDVEPKTLMNYRNLMQNHWLKSPISTVPLRNLKARHVQLALDQLGPGTTGNKLSRQTKSHLRAVLSNAMSAAVARGLIDANPVASIRFRQHLPQRARDQDVSQERWRLVHEAIEDSPFRVLYHLLMDGSLRMGEALALTWEDVNLGKPSEQRRPWVFVRSAIKERPRTNGKGVEQYLGKTKTDHSVRKVFLNQETVVLLHQLRRQQGKTPGLVFRSSGNEKREPNKGTISRDFKQRMEAAGIHGVTPRDLRHWAPTLMLSQGVPVPAVTKRLGHSQISTTIDRYAHVVTKDEEKAADALVIWDRTRRKKPDIKGEK